MNELDLKLYELLGDKTLSFGCVLENICGFHIKFASRYGDEGGFRTDDGGLENMEMMKIIGHEPTSTDLFKWMIDNDCAYATLGLWDDCLIFYGEGTGRERVKIPFDLSKKLIDQSEETKRAIVELISSHA